MLPRGVFSGGVSGPGGSASGGSGLGGCLLQGGLLRGGLLLGGSAPGGVVSQHALKQTPFPSPVNRMTDRCKNITLATTSLRPVKMANNMTVVSILSICTIKINMNGLEVPFIFTSTC